MPSSTSELSPSLSASSISSDVSAGARLRCRSRRLGLGARGGAAARRRLPPLRLLGLLLLLQDLRLLLLPRLERGVAKVAVIRVAHCRVRRALLLRLRLECLPDHI